MTTTNISPSSIVVEVLRGDNYDDWSACMKSYMLAQDLGDFIEPAVLQDVDYKTLRRKNAAALHAIQISCAPNILSKIRSITSAKDAWDNLHRQHSPSHKEQSVEAKSQGRSGAVSNEMNGPLLTLYKYAYNGNWDAIKTHLSKYPNATKAKLKPYGGTVLHVAAFSGHVRVVEELVKLISVEELEIQDNQGNTALFIAAIVGIRKMAECLVRKNEHLVTSENAQKKIPLVQACISNCKDMALYLYSVTPFEFLCQRNSHHGSYFLKWAIGAQMLEIAFDFLHRCPNLVLKSNALIYLSDMPHLFPSASRLTFWQQWIYSCIPMQSIATTDDNVRINMPDQSLSESKNIILQGIPMQSIATTDDNVRINIPDQSPSESKNIILQEKGAVTAGEKIMAGIPMQSIATTDDNVRINMPDQSLSESKNIIFQVSSKLRGFAINLLAFIGILMKSITTTDDNVRIDMPDQSLSESNNIIFQVSSKLRGFATNLLAFLGIKQIYDLKKTHFYSDKILQCMCKHISKLDFEEYDKADVHGAFHNAVKNGMVEFIIEVIKARPHLMVSVDHKSRNLFMSSIANRQEKVFSLFYGLEVERALFVSLVDISENTMLHLAAKLSPPSQLARISGAALQMQRELQWYKEVESITHPIREDYRNKDYQTARELFTSDHKDLVVKGEQWMKEAATSCTVVGALIITIMFTVAFTVPGGNVQETGYPVFKDEKSFTVFIVADAVSLFSSSTSVLMFLGILTSRYAEEDFLKSLPKKLIIGLSMLFFSIAAMMVTFCAALIIMLDGRLQLIIPIVLLASIPVTLFMRLQFPLLVEIFVSTYGQESSKEK